MRNSISLHHTYTQPQYRNRGLAAEVVGYAMDDVEHHSTRRVVPMCWYVAEWFDANPARRDRLYTPIGWLPLSSPAGSTSRLIARSRLERLRRVGIRSKAARAAVKLLQAVRGILPDRRELGAADPLLRSPRAYPAAVNAASYGRGPALGARRTACRVGRAMREGAAEAAQAQHPAGGPVNRDSAHPTGRRSLGGGEAVEVDDLDALRQGRVDAVNMNQPFAARAEAKGTSTSCFRCRT